jgi:gliding motility-associated peptidyl-prolyl isomerase
MSFWLNYALLNNNILNINQMNLKYLILFVFSILLISCNENPARMPISHKTGTFIKASVDRNKALIKTEEKAIDSILNLTPNLKFEKSLKGYKYLITKPNINSNILPQAGDAVTFEYEISDIFGNVIYSRQALGEFIYKVDKQDIMIGLRDGIKRLKVNEEAIFYFPSHLCFGYRGDDNKIGINYPLKVEIFIKSIASVNPKP